jgi:CheY-like chemotaxis protein
MPLPLIAVIDDDPSIRDLFTDLLETEGYRVITCASKAEALLWLQQTRPDVVILDLWIETPTGGWDLCAELEREPTLAHLPLIVCTSVPVKALPSEEVPCSPVAVLEKPFRVEELMAAIHRAVPRWTPEIGFPDARLFH